MRYLELNPVRALMVEHPGGYKWSSYHSNAQNQSNRLIGPNPLYNELGNTDCERRQAYRELFRKHIDEKIIHELRDSFNHERVLGRSYFKDKIEEMTKRQTRIGKSGRPRVEEESGVYVVIG